jgi:hypothetical protein
MNMHWKAYKILYPIVLVRIQIKLGIKKVMNSVTIACVIVKDF